MLKENPIDIPMAFSPSPRILGEVCWQINDEIECVEVYQRTSSELEVVPPPEGFWEKVVSTTDMIITLPVSRYSEAFDTITVKAEGGKVTIKDVLKAIYSRYQHPITSTEREKWEEYCKQWGCDPEESTVLVECMGGLLHFEGLSKQASGEYQLLLGS